MKYHSVFDIIGPVMIGPSSSHTAGAVRIGHIARKLFGAVPTKINVFFFRSFAQTYKGHATDVAIIGGILNLETDDIRIRNSLLIAKEENIEINFIPSNDYTDHPNTITIEMENDNDKIKVTGVSIGGGAVKIIKLNHYLLNLSGEHPTLLVLHKDVYGAVATVTKILAETQVNISYMEVSRIEKGSEALMLIETDQDIPKEAVDKISQTDITNKLILLG